MVFRHSSLDSWYVWGGAPIWNHTGSWSFSCEKSFRGVKVRLAFFAVLIRLMMQGGRVFA